MRSFDVPIINVADESQSHVPFQITEEACISFFEVSYFDADLFVNLVFLQLSSTDAYVRYRFKA